MHEAPEERSEAIAARCLEDIAYARQVVASDDHPEVRNAIIADLEEARGAAVQLNPQPLPPGADLFALSLWVQHERIWNQWGDLPRENLARLLDR
jgi:hypothetical protein